MQVHTQRVLTHELVCVAEDTGRAPLWSASQMRLGYQARVQERVQIMAV